jgi:hypothetical protein
MVDENSPNKSGIVHGAKKKRVASLRCNPSKYFKKNKRIKQDHITLLRYATTSFYLRLFVSFCWQR